MSDNNRTYHITEEIALRNVKELVFSGYNAKYTGYCKNHSKFEVTYQELEK